jgi:hypothetical protein
LLPFSSQAIRKRVRDRGVGAGVTPEFMTKRNSQLVGIRGRIAADAERAEIGELEVCGDARDETRFRSGGGIRATTVVATCVRKQQR